MIKKGDRVFLVYNMNVKGTVVDLISEQSNQWMVGGAASKRLIAHVQLDDVDEIQKFKLEQIMRLD